MCGISIVSQTDSTCSAGKDDIGPKMAATPSLIWRHTGIEQESSKREDNNH